MFRVFLGGIWVAFVGWGFSVTFFCRIISDDSVWFLLWVDGVENLKKSF